MEALAILSAIPPLIELLLGTAKILQACASSSSIVKATKGLDVQLTLLIEIVRSIDNKWKAKGSPTDRLSRLGAILNELRTEITSLNLLLVRGRDSNSPFRRARWAAGGSEKQLKLHVQRVESIKTLLTLKIVDDIDTTASENSKAARLSRRLQIKDVLQPTSADFIPSKLAGTLNWVWSHPALAKLTVENTTEPKDRILCIYGVKGCGKSVLASSIAADLKDRNAVVGFFSFWSGSESQRRITSWLSTLVWQLLEQLSESDFDEAAKQLMQGLPSSTSSLLETLRRLLALVQQPTWIIVDGVDESADAWSRMEEGGPKIVQDLVKNHSNVRVVILGRESILYEALKQLPSLELTQDLLHDDIAQLIAAELSLSTNITSDSFRDHVQCVLQDKATVMFLWVKLVFRELQKCFSAAEIKATLDDLPADLDEEYRRLFAALARRLGQVNPTAEPPIRVRRAQGLLSIIVGTAEPLTLEELRYAYATTSHPGKGWEEHLLSDDGILDACGDFVQISGDRIHLGHSSIEEFLVRPAHNSSSMEGSGVFTIDPVRNHESIGVTCLNYLNNVDWGYPLHDESFMQLSESSLFLQYAHRHAIYHLLQSPEPTAETVRTVKQFVESRQLCKWMEYSFLDLLHEFNTTNLTIDLMQFAGWYERVCREPLASVIQRRVREELHHRHLLYGADDPRSQSWESIESIGNFWSFLDPEVHREIGWTGPAIETQQQSLVHSTKSRRDDRPGRNAQDDSATAIAQNLQMLNATSTQLSATKYAAMILRASNSVLKFRVDPLQLLFSSILKSCAQLPILVVLMIAMHYDRFNRLEEAMQISVVAARRAEGKKDFEEAATKVQMGYLFEQLDKPVLAEEHFREAMEILQSLPQTLQAEFLMDRLILYLGRLLSDTNQLDAFLELRLKRIKVWTDSTATKPSGSRWERYARSTEPWIRHRFRYLRYTVNECAEVGFDYEALSIAAQARVYLENHGKAGKELAVEMDKGSATILFDMGRASESAGAWRRIIATETRKSNSTSNKRAVFDCRYQHARALFALGESDEAESFFREALTQYGESSYSRWGATEYLASILDRRGEVKEARELISKLDFAAPPEEMDVNDFMNVFMTFWVLNWQSSDDSDGDQERPSFESWLSDLIISHSKATARRRLLWTLHAMGDILDDLECTEEASAVWDQVQKL